MLVEPPQTEYDWKFQLFDVPVRVHPFFWLMAVVMGLRGGDARSLTIWVFSVFVSILIHEFGHAFAIRYYGWSARVVLYGFGGLAIHDHESLSWMGGRRATRRAGDGSQIWISLAGPFAGFAFAGLIVLALHLSGYTMGIGFPVLGIFEIPLGSGDRMVTNANLFLLVYDLMQINVFWGIMNLAPIYPLDGGQVARELLIRQTRDGLRLSLQLSAAVGFLIAFIAIFHYERLYIGVLFGYLAYNSYQQLSGPYGGARW